MPKDNEVDEKAVAWLITYTERDGSKRQAVYTHNAIADWRMFDPAATSEPLYSAATVAELRAKADAAERRVGELVEAIREYRFFAACANRGAIARLDALTGADPT